MNGTPEPLNSSLHHRQPSLPKFYDDNQQQRREKFDDGIFCELVGAGMGLFGCAFAIVGSTSGSADWVCRLRLPNLIFSVLIHCVGVFVKWKYNM
jgi:hypothetical protein